MKPCNPKPFGIATLDHNTGEWEPFHVSDVMALGAYARDEEARESTRCPLYWMTADERTGSHSHWIGLLQGYPVCVEQGMSVFYVTSAMQFALL